MKFSDLIFFSFLLLMFAIFGEISDYLFGIHPNRSETDLMLAMGITILRAVRSERA